MEHGRNEEAQGRAKIRGCVFATPANKASATGFSAAAVWIEKKVAIAAGYHAIRSPQDRPDLVPQMMIAPIPWRDRLFRQQRLGELTICCAGPTTIMSAQIENMPDLRLVRQCTVGWSERSTGQCPPELARCIEPRLEGGVERQDNGIDAR